MKLREHATLVTGTSRARRMDMHLSTTATPDQRINAQYRIIIKVSNAPKELVFGCNILRHQDHTLPRLPRMTMKKSRADNPEQPSDKYPNGLSSDGRHRVFGPGRVKKNHGVCARSERSPT